jgi:O-antigen ligase
MSVISLATIWSFTRWLESGKGWERRKSLLNTVFLLGALLFRQTRMRIISITVVVWAALLIRRKWKPLVVFFLISMAVFAVMNTAMEKNILTNAFSTAFTDVLDNTGTYPGRYVQMVEDLKEFKRHPWVGSGAGAVRAPTALGGSRLQYTMEVLTAKSDLGYSSWLSSYGLAGAAWLFLFFYVQFSMALKALKRTAGNDNILAHFALSYLIYELVSFITLPHLMHPESIIMDTLVAAVIVRLYYKTRDMTTAENDSGKLARHGELESAVGLP